MAGPLGAFYSGVGIFLSPAIFGRSGGLLASALSALFLLLVVGINKFIKMSLYLGLFWGVRRTAKSPKLLQYLGPLSDIAIFSPVSGPCLGCSLHRVGAVSIPVPFYQ